MHGHVSALSALTVFFLVLVCGTFWRLLAAHFATSQSPILVHAGRAMAFQY